MVRNIDRNAMAAARPGLCSAWPLGRHHRGNAAHKPPVVNKRWTTRPPSFWNHNPDVLLFSPFVLEEDLVKLHGVPVH
jgi:hypothetical protein